MKISNIEEDKKYLENREDEIDRVDHKLVLKLETERSYLKEDIKAYIRYIFKSIDVGIRNRVDLSEDSLLDKDYIEGVFLAVVRLQKNTFNNELKDKLNVINEEGILRFINLELFDVRDFVSVEEVFDRVVYEVKIEISDDVVYGYSESQGTYKTDILRWDNSRQEERLKGLTKVRVHQLDSKSNVAKLIIDVPLGVDIYSVLDIELGLKRKKYIGYPVKGLEYYKSIGKDEKFINRDRCEISGDYVEKTVGEVIGTRNVENTYLTQ